MKIVIEAEVGRMELSTKEVVTSERLVELYETFLRDNGLTSVVEEVASEKAVKQPVAEPKKVWLNDGDMVPCEVGCPECHKYYTMDVPFKSKHVVCRNCSADLFLFSATGNFYIPNASGAHYKAKSLYTPKAKSLYTPKLKPRITPMFDMFKRGF